MLRNPRVATCVAMLAGITHWDAPGAEVTGPDRGVYLVRFDGGRCEGRMATTHQGGREYWARKQLDFRQVPREVWQRATEARVALFMYVHDHSRWRTGNPALDKENGLNDSFDLVVNGHVHRFPTGQRIGVEYEEIGWSDFPVPKSELVWGENEVIVRKSADSTDGDDYVYIAIDSSQRHGRSAVSLDSGKTWREAPLNVPGATGEYMVRAKVLLPLEPLRAEWALGKDGRFSASPELAGLHTLSGGRQATAGWLLEKPDDKALVEVDADSFDSLSPIRVAVEFSPPSPGKEARVIALGDHQKELHALDTHEAETATFEVRDLRAIAVKRGTQPVEISRMGVCT